jgi:hypothetical protein
MKSGLIFIVFFVSVMSGWAFQQDKLVILFDSKSSKIQEDSQYLTYRFDPNRVSFQHDKKRHRKQTISRDSINADVISYRELLKRISKKEFPEGYRNYTFFIALEKGSDTFSLVEVEPIWIIDEEEY